MSYFNDYSLIDGDRIIRGHKTEYALGKFAVGQLEKIKILSMHIALSEAQTDTLIDCIIDEYFASNSDMEEFEDKLESIGLFLDYYLDRLSETIQIPAEKDESDKICENPF